MGQRERERVRLLATDWEHLEPFDRLQGFEWWADDDGENTENINSYLK